MKDGANGLVVVPYQHELKDGKRLIQSRDYSLFPLCEKAPRTLEKSNWDGGDQGARDGLDGTEVKALVCFSTETQLGAICAACCVLQQIRALAVDNCKLMVPLDRLLWKAPWPKGSQTHSLKLFQEQRFPLLCQKSRVFLPLLL